MEKKVSENLQIMEIHTSRRGFLKTWEKWTNKNSQNMFTVAADVANSRRNDTIFCIGQG